MEKDRMLNKFKPYCKRSKISKYCYGYFSYSDWDKQVYRVVLKKVL